MPVTMSCDESSHCAARQSVSKGKGFEMDSNEYFVNCITSQSSCSAP